MYSINSGNTKFTKDRKLFSFLSFGSRRKDPDLEYLFNDEGDIRTDDTYFKNILDHVPHLIYGRDAEGRYTVVNQAFVDFAGIAKSKILGNTDKELQIFLNTEQVRSADEAIFLTKQKKYIPLEPFTDRFGNLYWFQTLKTPILDEDGEVKEILIVSTDITKKVDVEQKLMKSEIRYRSIFKNNYSGIIVIDKDLEITNKNRAFGELLNSSAPNLMSNDLKSFLIERDRKDLLDLVNGLSTRNYESFDIDIQLLAEDGEVKDTICFVRGIYGEMGDFSEAVVTFQDVTAERLQQKQLEESEQRFRILVEHASEALLLLDFDTKMYVDANKSAQELFGYTKEEFKNLKLGELSPKLQDEDEKSAELSLEYMTRAVNGEPVVYEWQAKKKSGDLMYCEVRLVKMPYPGRTIIRTSLVDITERRLAEDLLNKEKSKLQESNTELVNLNFQLGNQTKQLQEFAYIASHNLRSPAGNISALLDFYKSDPSEENLEILLSKLDVVAKDLMDTINDLAEVVKIKNEVSKDHSEVNLAKLIDKCKESLSQTISNKKAVIEVELGEHEHIYAARSYIESILINLLSNALKYSDAERAPKVKISAQVLDDKFAVSVEDNGLGIDLERYGSKVFGLRKTFHRNKDSRGVGLFITKAQVEALGGEITVESEVNKGTKFTMYFPMSILKKK